jgi:hypothetical protein
MASLTSAHDDVLLRAARRLLADIGGRIGPRPAAAIATVDRRGIAAMVAELEVQLHTLRQRRDELGQEIVLAARRMNAAAVYAKFRIAGQNGAQRARRRTNDGAGS